MNSINRIVKTVNAADEKNNPVEVDAGSTFQISQSRGSQCPQGNTNCKLFNTTGYRVVFDRVKARLPIIWWHSGTPNREL